MPWHVKKRSGKRPYKIIKSTTGEVVGSSTSKADAEASERARYANSPDTNDVQRTTPPISEHKLPRVMFGQGFKK